MDFNYLWAAHIGSFKSFMDGKIIADSTQRFLVISQYKKEEKRE
jgi:hypothetical protein